MSGNGNPPETRQTSFVPSGLAIREPPPTSQYPSSPANTSFPHQSHPFDNPQVQRHQTNLHVHHLIESQSQSLRVAESGSLEGSESQDTQREKQRLVQGWAFNSQPPSLGQVQGSRSHGPPGEIGARQYVEPPRMIYVARPGGMPYPAYYGPVPGPPHPAYQIHQPIHPYYQHQQHPFHPHYPPPNGHGHQSPSNPSNGRNRSPHQSMQDHRFHPLDPNHPMNRDPREGYNRMGSPMAIGNLVGEYSDPNRRSSSSARMAESPRREDPRGDLRGAGSGTMMTGLAAGLESPEQSMRSSRGERESHGDHHPSYASTSQRPLLDVVADSQRTRRDNSDSYSGPYANSRPNSIQGRPDNPESNLYRVNGMIYRTEVHASAQRPQQLESRTARSSVVPGTPSERFEDSMDTSHDGQDEPVESPARDYGRRSMDSVAAGRREALALNGLVSAERFSVVPHGAPKISPHRQRSSPFGTSPSRQRPTGLQLSPNNESMSLEATQRDEVLVQSPMRIMSPDRHARLSKSPPKAINHLSSPHLPRPALTSGPVDDADDDTFIGVDDRKTALRKRSNAEIDNHMNGLPVLPAIETASPMKRKKVGTNGHGNGEGNGNGKTGVLSTGDLAERKTPGRGELHNRKPLAMVSMPRTETTSTKPTKSPSKKQKISHPSVPAQEGVPPLVRKDLFLSAESSDAPLSDVSDPSSRKIALYRRLGKTSAAGSTVSLHATTIPVAVSLEGIESFEKRGEVVAPAERMLEETQIRQVTATVEVIEDKQPGATDPYLNSPTHSPKRKGKGKRLSDASLTPIPTSEEDEPTVQTLVMHSPARLNKNPVKTYKSPNKQKRRRSASKSGSVVAEAAVDGDESDAEDFQRNSTSAKRHGRATRKIMSPTVSPVPVHQPAKRAAASQSSSDSLSDAPAEGPEDPDEWEPPLPLLKDDPRDRDFRPASHSQAQGSPLRKIGTRRESTSNLPGHRAKRVLARWDGSFYPGNLLGKNKKKFAGLFDDGADFKLDAGDLRQCIFHKGDSISMAKQTTPKLPISGSLEVIGTVDPDVDISEPLMPEDKLVVRASNGKEYDIAVKYCIFEDDQEDALDNREFDEDILDLICGPSSPDGDIPKKATRAGKAVIKVENPKKEFRSALRPLHRSESRSDRIKPLHNFAFVISNIHMHGSTERKALKAKIVGAGGRVMEDLFELYPRQKGDRFGSDDIALARNYHNLNGIFLLVLPPAEYKSPFLTEKYMMALALGIPCLSATFIDELLNPDETVTWHSFLLSAGVSQQLKGEVSQIVDHRTGEGPEHLVKTIDCGTVVRRPFNGRSFLIATGVKDVMRYICAMMGASLVIVAESKTRSRKATSVTPDAISEIPSDHTSTDVDYIIVSDVTPENKIVKNLASKTCNVEWVKQCLIMGKLYAPSLMHKEKLVIEVEN